VLGADIEAYLAELVAELRDRLGRRLVGAWLFGSGALGDFDPATSDLDVQVVTTGRLARAEREALAVRLSHPALVCPVRGLELSFTLVRISPTRSARRSSSTSAPGRVWHSTWPVTRARTRASGSFSMSRSDARPGAL
jgi:predicted nucleotidyltransferase